MPDKIVDILQGIALVLLAIDNLNRRQEMNDHFKMIDEAYKHIIIIKNKLGLPLFLDKGEKYD